MPDDWKAKFRELYQSAQERYRAGRTTTLTLFDYDAVTVLVQNDDGPAGPVNSYIEFTPASAIRAANVSAKVWSNWTARS